MPMLMIDGHQSRLDAKFVWECLPLDCERLETPQIKKNEVVDVEI